MIVETSLHRIDPVQRMARSYRLEIAPDLFGAWVLTREWGRIGRQGQRRLASYPTTEAARAALDKLKAAKVKRGYQPP